VAPGGGGGGGVGGGGGSAALGKVVCRVCNTGSGIEKVALPFVFKYLASELAAMNIRIGLEISDGA